MTKSKRQGATKGALKGARPIRVLLGPGETGWVQPSHEGFVVSNIPLNPRVNYGDVVSLRLLPLRGGKGGKSGVPPMSAVDRVLSRTFRRKMTLWYDQPRQFGPLVKRLRAAGAMTEGAVGPDKGRRGFVMVAYNTPTNPVAIAREVGIDRPRSKEARS